MQIGFGDVPRRPIDDAFRRPHEEVARAAGGIADPQIEDCAQRIVGPFGPIEQRFDRTVEESVDDPVRGVEGAAMLSPLACRLLDPQPTGVGIETRDMFEEPFVHPGQIVFVGSRAGVRTEDRTDEPLGLAREGFHRSTTSLITEVRSTGRTR